MTREEFVGEAKIALALYAAGVEDGSYERHMDSLSVRCSDAQWEELDKWLDAADFALAETDKGTLWQREKLVALREGRPSRYPCLLRLYSGDARARETLRALAEEHGIQEPNYNRFRAPEEGLL